MSFCEKVFQKEAVKHIWRVCHFFPMEDPEKNENPDLPQISMTGQTEIHPNDLLVLQRIFSEAEPINALYTEECIDPLALHFVPENAWSQQNVSLHFLHEDYFGRKNNVNRRFEHKLWNALLITQAFPNMTKLVGVTWATETVIKVYKFPFAKLLNITAIDGGLFHKQGNFTRHGFVTLSDADAKLRVPQEQLADVDFRDVLLIMHGSQQFTMKSNETTISQCKWESPGGATRVASLKTDVMPILQSS
ncbi:hypothetical protein TRFO_23773 [Tritrichomonas foetus]|uniref:Initiator binding domain-containing protein n=1 Tax=Tritrichomonas foetus TaxID=1144522 RepID=A0A1J4K8K7_9EUKA|nr:hypothetical protein TRFO_23773 [Tritrichomonas foetus]|eukprot:OHT07833.1 hypothetical protein TRFO_23773 [Tritrichomonas foetus]